MQSSEYLPGTRSIRPGLVRAGLLSLLFAAFLWLSWSGRLDQMADDRLQPAFKQSLITLAAARGLNSLLSVAQGTEIALQPAGIGVILSAGEILDPLNDLVERFSWLVLMAAASLGIQIALTGMFSSAEVNLVFSVVVGLCLLCVWLCRTRMPVFGQNARLSGYAVRLAGVLMLFRFTLAAVSLVAALLSQHFLEAEQNESIQILQHTSRLVEQEAYIPDTPNTSLLDSVSNYLSEQKHALDMEARLTRLKERIESTIGHIINLIVLYILQTLLIPIAVLYLFQKIVRATWKALTPPES